eukprot:Pgem_evm1s20129
MAILTVTPKLESAEDWPVWKQTVTTFLKSKGLYKYIKEEDAKGEDDGKTEKEKSKVLLTIGMNVSGDVKLSLVNKEEPYEVWKTLETEFENKTLSQMKIYQKELRNLSIDTEKDVKTLCIKIEIRCNLLKTGGINKESTDKIDYLTEALSDNPNWNDFRRAVRMMSEKDRTWEKIKQEAQKEEIDLTLEGLINTNKEKVLETQEKGYNCHKCGKKGHKRAECTNTTTVKTCDYCNKKGHEEQRCWLKHGKENITKKEESAYFTRERVLIIKEKTPTKVLKTKEITNMIIDSGATSHVVTNKEQTKNFKKEGIDVSTLGEKVSCQGIGELKNLPGRALVVPEAKETIISVSQLTKNGYILTFDYKVCYSSDKNSAASWHRRLGHASLQRIKSVLPEGMTIEWPESINCETCAETNIKKAPLSHKKKKEIKIVKLGNSLDVDIVGPMEKSSIGGNKWALMIVDRATKYTWFRPMKNKGQKLETLMDFLDEELSKRQIKVESIHSDNEFRTEEIDRACKERGIKQSYTAPDSSLHNAFVERRNGITVGMARALLQQNSLPKKLWAEALDYACLCSNVLPTKGTPNGKTPWENWQNTTFDMNRLKEFGCKAYVHKKVPGKLSNRGVECNLLGPDLDTIGNCYTFYNKSTGRIIKSRSFTIFEGEGANDDMTDLEFSESSDSESSGDNDAEDSEDDDVTDLELEDNGEDSSSKENNNNPNISSNQDNNNKNKNLKVGEKISYTFKNGETYEGKITRVRTKEKRTYYDCVFDDPDDDSTYYNLPEKD